MLWIKEVEMVDSVDDLKFSCSVKGIHMPDAWGICRNEDPSFEVRDTKIASALNKIIHNTPSWKTDRLLDLRVLPGHWSQRFCRKLCRLIHYRSTK